MNFISNLQIESIVALLLSALIFILSSIIVFLVKKIYNEVQRVSEFIARQDEINKSLKNEIEHISFRIEDHEKRLTKLELK